MIHKTFQFLYDAMCFSMEEFADRIATPSAGINNHNPDTKTGEIQDESDIATLRID